MVDDVIRGPVRFENRLTDDLVIARGDGTPLYNFAVAVDDADMGITDVIRGDDHLSNTPKQLLVLDALGATPPRYAHLPLLHGPDGKKLSKRHGAASVQELRDGRLPAGRGPQLPRAARLGRRGRRDDPLDRGAGRAVLDRAGRPLGGDLRRAQAALAERPLHARAGASRPTSKPRRRSSNAPGTPEAAADRERLARRLRDRAGEGADAGRGLAADRVPVRAARRRSEGVVEGDGATGARRGPRGGARGAARRPSRSTRRRSRPSSPRSPSARLKPRDLYQPIRVAITGTTVSPGIFESLAALGREDAVSRIEAAARRL